MVLLTMTPAVVATIKAYNNINSQQEQDGEPSLADPVVGGPISHGQLIEISQFLKEYMINVENWDNDLKLKMRLSDLLEGCGLYVPPPAPKPEKSNEYKALMARLRKEEEAKSYDRMLQSSQTHISATPAAAAGYLFPPSKPDFDDEMTDEMTYADINRQMALIANVIISILACSIGVWKVAWHWDVPARLALSMTSSFIVAAAEVAIYFGYIGRLEEAKKVERKKVEKRVVGESWVIESKKGGGLGRKEEKESAVDIGKRTEDVLAEGLRLRAKLAKP